MYLQSNKPKITTSEAKEQAHKEAAFTRAREPDIIYN